MLELLKNIGNWLGEYQIWNWLCYVAKGDSGTPVSNITYIILGCLLIALIAIYARRSWREKFF